MIPLPSQRLAAADPVPARTPPHSRAWFRQRAAVDIVDVVLDNVPQMYARAGAEVPAPAGALMDGTKAALANLNRVLGHITTIREAERLSGIVWRVIDTIRAAWPSDEIPAGEWLNSALLVVTDIHREAGHTKDDWGCIMECLSQLIELVDDAGRCIEAGARAGGEIRTTIWGCW
ncbi:MAG: hypothetical protein KQJ78_23130 [Deltaproteobacteria bacterium]|nr:hypothetical protein [Deltaproteobacteria bacterium]